MPIIILSARASEEDRIEALEAGADEALGKPISSRELMVKVQNHVQLGRMRIELEKKVMDRTRALLDAEVRSRDLAEQLGTVSFVNASLPSGAYLFGLGVTHVALWYLRQH